MGFLFSGPPGTRKTSLVRATAMHFNLCIYRVSLKDESLSENNLMRLLENTCLGSILLLEDINATGISREELGQREGDNLREGSRISLLCLLNVIDGIGAPEARIVIMTTNHPERLDPALTQKGHVNMKIEIGLVSSSQIQDMFLMIFALSSKKDSD